MAVFAAFSSRLPTLGILTSVCGLAVISVASLSPVGSAGDPGSADKTMHIVAYALAILPLVTVSSRCRIGIALGALIWSGLIELLQLLVGRSASFSDLMANAAGIFLGLSVAALFRRILLNSPR